MTGSAQAANQAISALIAQGIELADFSMGSPSLEEVFFALTGGSGRLAKQKENDQ
jgi:ABC-2 type transport system ATP-binding protein